MKPLLCGSTSRRRVLHYASQDRQKVLIDGNILTGGRYLKSDALHRDMVDFVRHCEEWTGRLVPLQKNEKGNQLAMILRKKEGQIVGLGGICKSS